MWRQWASVRHLSGLCAICSANGDYAFFKEIPWTLTDFRGVNKGDPLSIIGHAHVRHPLAGSTRVQSFLDVFGHVEQTRAIDANPVNIGFRTRPYTPCPVLGDFS